MKIIAHMFLVLLCLSCTGCMTQLVIKDATKGAPKTDKIEFVRAFEYDNDFIFHVNGSLAEGINAKYTIKFGNEWVSSTGSDYFFIKRTNISEGFSVPTMDWTELKIFKRFDYRSEPDYKGQGCYLVQECLYGICKPKVDYECFDGSKSKFILKKVFYLQSELGFPPVYKFLFIPLTLPFDIITFPFQYMLLKPLSGAH